VRVAGLVRGRSDPVRRLHGQHHPRLAGVARQIGDWLRFFGIRRFVFGVVVWTGRGGEKDAAGGGNAHFFALFILAAFLSLFLARNLSTNQQQKKSKKNKLKII